MPRRGEWPDVHLPRPARLGDVWQRELRRYRRWLAGEAALDSVYGLNAFLRCVLPPYEVLPDGALLAFRAFDF